MKFHQASLIVLTTLAVMLSGCEKPATSVNNETVVTVGGDKIGEAELNHAVSGLGELNEAQAAEAKSRMLQALIDQHLVAQAARKSGVDKDPAVEIAMAQASRQVLVEAYAERSLKDIAPPSDSEITDYYNQHPELFSQRRVYRIQELELKLDPSRMAEVEAKLKSSHSMGDFVNWLKEQGIEGQTAVAVKPAEQIPAPLLAGLSQMKDGQVTVLPGRDGHMLIQQLQESQLQAVSLEQAKNAIERVLRAQKRKDLMETELKKLRETAKIDYATGYAPATEAGADSAQGHDKPVNVPPK